MIIRLSKKDRLFEESVNLYLAGFPHYVLLGQNNDSDLIAAANYYNECLLNYRIVMTNKSGDVIASAKTLPYRVNEDKLTEELPDDLLDLFLEGIKQHQKEEDPNSIIVFSITVDNRYQGKGISSKMIKEIKNICKQDMFKNMLLPVRPTLKHKYPLTDMDSYQQWKNEENSLFDPWIRTHVKNGGKILRIAKGAQKFTGTVEDWQEWTGMIFPETGRYIIDGALSPLEIDISKDIGNLVEDNIWIKYDILSD